MTDVQGGSKPPKPNTRLYITMPPYMTKASKLCSVRQSQPQSCLLSFFTPIELHEGALKKLMGTYWLYGLTGTAEFDRYAWASAQTQMQSPCTCPCINVKFSCAGDHILRAPVCSRSKKKSKRNCPACFTVLRTCPYKYI